MVPITAVIIVCLFTVERFGTAAVGRFFGPVMIVWFTSIGACGVWGITKEPGILKALSPTYALAFVTGHFHIAFFALAAIVLAVTGAEALYADMGHFGRAPISLGWIFLVLPACTLSYFGQGALVLEDRANLSAPFFLLTPGWGRVPMVLLATAATVIASQAVITGAFSVAAQAAQLGYLPRLRVVHTSRSTHGQIYVPWINWLLLVSVLTLVFAFRSSAALAFAFGMAVTGTITITTILFFYVAARTWRTPRWLLASGAVVLLTVDLLFLAANLTKLVHGAWLPARHRGDRIHGHDDLATRAATRDNSKRCDGRLTRRVRRQPARPARPRHRRTRYGDLPQPRQLRPLRLPYAPTSSTTMSATNTSSSCQSRSRQSRGSAMANASPSTTSVIAPTESPMSPCASATPKPPTFPRRSPRSRPRTPRDR